MSSTSNTDNWSFWQEWIDWSSSSKNFTQDITQLQKAGPVIYWMVREHRIEDNRALALAQFLAIKNKLPLIIVFTLRSDLSTAMIMSRTLGFMLQGLREAEVTANELNIPFHLLEGDPVKELSSFAQQLKSKIVITDSFPLSPYRGWQNDIKVRLAKNDQGALLIVDGRSLVPAWIASDKKEFSARTFRPKIHKKLAQFQHPVLKIIKHPFSLSTASIQINWAKVRHKTLIQTSWQGISLNKIDQEHSRAGEKAAYLHLKNSFKNLLAGYHLNRNDPALDATTRLSAYLHFGHLSAQQVVREIELEQIQGLDRKDAEALVEQLVVRRDLAENFCYYSSLDDYRTLAGAPAWAQKTLLEHQDDDRPYVYTAEELLWGKTHEQSWNAAQHQLIKTGFMHGYMRMYWAKKILEWSVNPQQALETAIALNDLLELDGRDPNGYVGILWAIAGLHDRPWFERPIFGKIRYMNEAGLKRKFAIDQYHQQWLGLDN